MTMTSSQRTPDPDEECRICGTKREEHGDRNHEFSSDGVLVPKKAPEPPREQAPQRRSYGGEAKPDPTAAYLRLVERLIAKNLLNGEDLIYIFGGGNAHS